MTISMTAKKSEKGLDSRAREILDMLSAMEPINYGTPALIITCGFDRLRDEGKAYADKLGAAGVDVSHSCYTNMIHGFISFGGFLQQGQAAIHHCAGALLEAFA
jgi:acetyl esterase